ncbi:MAG: hypothetical protein HUJ68_04955 [Clostridia bacterium]|nr:hypothetical protein [Clostridia bacterium]
MLTKQEAKRLDKFYTKKEVAEKLLKTTKEILNLNGEELFLEPSAGNGVFVKLIKNIDAYDLAPEYKNIKKANFLEVKLKEKNYITIGNPPFGNRCNLAIDFFNKCANHSKIIAFIVPITFLKWSVQSQLNEDFKLVYFEELKENSFTLLNEEYNIRCCFQIWVLNNTYPNLKNFRIMTRPAISHSDFLIWQHNATEASRKYVDEDWEIATWRQGYKNYNEIFTREDYDWLREQVYNTNLQFFYIKPLTKKSREVINKMDFNKLARRNMRTPGFGKGDFVAYYNELLLLEEE